MSKLSKYDRWIYTAIDKDTEFPLITHLLFQVCSTDQKRFAIGQSLFRQAFEAGQKAGHDEENDNEER